MSDRNETIIITSEETALLKRVLDQFCESMGKRKSPPRGWTYAEVVSALNAAEDLQLKLP